MQPQQHSGINWWKSRTDEFSSKMKQDKRTENDMEIEFLGMTPSSHREDVVHGSANACISNHSPFSAAVPISFQQQNSKSAVVAQRLAEAERHVLSLRRQLKQQQRQEAQMARRNAELYKKSDGHEMESAKQLNNNGGLSCWTTAYESLHNNASSVANGPGTLHRPHRNCYSGTAASSVLCAVQHPSFHAADRSRTVSGGTLPAVNSSASSSTTAASATTTPSSSSSAPCPRATVSGDLATRQWLMGQKIRCLWKENEYAAKIVGKEQVMGRLFYRIHYVGWTTRHDETIGQSEAMCRFRDWDESELPPGVFNIDRISGMRKRKNREEYRVHWEGYDSADDTWESASKLLSDGCGWAIDEFKQKFAPVKDEEEQQRFSVKRKRSGSAFKNEAM
uniref:Chromo domain-containing protein n=1 Tax=Globodera rostochiensis TaxID=31243 RepID=A0A914GZL3_GLORO